MTGNIFDNPRFEGVMAAFKSLCLMQEFIPLGPLLRDLRPNEDGCQIYANHDLTSEQLLQVSIQFHVVLKVHVFMSRKATTKRDGHNAILSTANPSQRNPSVWILRKAVM